MLTRDEIFSSIATLPREACEAFGGTVMVQGLTALEKDELDNSCWVQNGAGRQWSQLGLRARWVQKSVVTETGQRIFEPADLLRINGLPGKDVDRVIEVAQRLSGDLPSAMRDLEKNSASGPSA